MSTRIFVMTHKKFDEPDNDAYIPLHVGRASSEDLGYVGDDTGESISRLNYLYGELTGVYWLWKNYNGADNIGICHYRRFFQNADGSLMGEEDFEKIFRGYDVIASEKVVSDKSWYEGYKEAHHIEDLMEVRNSVQKLFPEYLEEFDHSLHFNEHYYANLMVMPKKHFDGYCKWMFDILFDASMRITPPDEDLYHKRVYGFLSEGMLGVYLRYHGLKVYESRIGIMSEKAETTELKRAIGHLISQNRIEEAAELFSGVMKVRPDVALPMSDIFREMPVIEQILYICLEQKKMGEPLLTETVSKDLKELITFFRQASDALHRISMGKEDVSDRQYLAGFLGTKSALMLIIKVDAGGRFHNDASQDERLAEFFDKLKED